MIKRTVKKITFIISETIKASPLMGVIIIASSVMEGFTPVVQIYVLKRLLEILTKKQFNIKEILILILIEIFVLTLKQVLENYKQIITELCGKKLSYRIQGKIIDKIKKIEFESFDDPSFYNIFTNASTQAENNSQMILLSLTALFSLIISMGSFVVIIVSISPLSLFLIIVTMIPFIIFKFRFQGKLYDFAFNESTERRKTGYYYDTLTDFKNMYEIRLYDLYGFFTKKRNESFKQHYKRNVELSKKEILWYFLFSILSRVGSIPVLLMVIKNASAGIIDIGDFSMYFTAIISFQDSFLSMIEMSAYNYKSLLFLDFLFDFLNHPTKKGERNLLINKKKKHVIEFCNVSFRYPFSENYVLKNINLKFETPETLIIVGENGSGKTTLIKLLLRLYEPTEGIILVDGKNINLYDQGALHSIFGVMYQNISKYAVSIKESIALGNINNLDSDDLIQQTGHLCKADEFIGRTQYGYNSNLTRMFDENGVEPSTGEWQKLALARTLFSDADILILDEPTASLDPKMEQAVYELIKNMKDNKIVLLITHQLSLATIASTIVHLQDGIIIECGTHAKLMKTKGEYSTLYSMQSEKFNDN